MSLCDYCRGINIELLSAPDGYEHVPSWSLLSNFCTLCKQIHANWFRFGKRPDTRAPLRLALERRFSDSGSVDAYLKLFIGTDVSRTYIFVMTDYGM